MRIYGLNKFGKFVCHKNLAFFLALSVHIKNFFKTASPASESLHLHLLPPLKPTRGVRKRIHPAGCIMQYDGEIVHYNNQQYLPSQIAELLCKEHGLDSNMMNRKTVERRLCTIKKKGIAMVAPVSEDTDLLARDSEKNLSLFFTCIILIVFVGQQSAMSVGDTLTDGAEESLSLEEPEAIVEAPPSPQEENLITLAHFQDAGFNYTEEGEKNWVLFLVQLLNSTICVQGVREDSVIINWDAIPPSDAEVISVCDLTLMPAIEMSFLQMCVLSLFNCPRIP